jgi:XRE family aerobic/anaerobic benzoate catabolism transcriptional regulator
MAQDNVDTFFASVGQEAAQTAAGADLDAAAYLRRFGQRLAQARHARGMSRRLLASRTGLSARYINRAEIGTGNVSLQVLRALARALGLAPRDLLEDRPDSALESLVATLDPAQQAAAHALLVRHFATTHADGGLQRIALVGAPGSGKTSLGTALAAALGVPFIELDTEIARAAGTGLRITLERVGESGRQRIEHRVLETILARKESAVIAAGSGIVAAPMTYNLLLRSCHTIWLRAGAEQHLARSLPPGAPQPDRKTIRDQRAVLAAQEPHFILAGDMLDTSQLTLEESVTALLDLARRHRTG